MNRSHSDWEDAFRRELEITLFNADSDHRGTSEGLEVEAVRLEGSFPETEVVILFRDKERPKCTFGFRWGSLWEWVAKDPQTPETLAHIVWANFEEATLDLPECHDDEALTWIE